MKQPVDRESAVERHCRRRHRPRALWIAPACKEPPAARARGLRYQSNSRGEASLEFGGEADGYSRITRQGAGTSSARSTAPGYERWYVKFPRPRKRPRALRRSASAYHRSKERDECAIRVGNDSTNVQPSLKKDSWAEYRWG